MARGVAPISLARYQAAGLQIVVGDQAAGDGSETF